jgi:hypothetical protein
MVELNNIVKKEEENISVMHAKHWIVVSPMALGDTCPYPIYFGY